MNEAQQAATIEPMLIELIRQHGVERVRADLETLFTPGVKWRDWESVLNLVNRIGNRLSTPQSKNT